MLTIWALLAKDVIGDKNRNLSMSKTATLINDRVWGDLIPRTVNEQNSFTSRWQLSVI